MDWIEGIEIGRVQMLLYDGILDFWIWRYCIHDLVFLFFVITLRVITSVHA